MDFKSLLEWLSFNIERLHGLNKQRVIPSGRVELSLPQGYPSSHVKETVEIDKTMKRDDLKKSPPPPPPADARVYALVTADVAFRTTTIAVQ